MNRNDVNSETASIAKDNNREAMFWLTTSSVGALLVSIAVSQILLVLTCVLWVYQRHRLIRVPAFLLPLCALFLTTLSSWLLSPEPSKGLAPLYKFWLIVIVLLTANSVWSLNRARTVLKVLLLVGAGVALIGIVQFWFHLAQFRLSGALVDDPTILNRITGLMGHWMTFGGQLMLLWCASIPLVLNDSKKWFLPAAVISAAIVLSFTRSVWIGSAAGLLAAFPFLPKRLLLKYMVPVAVVAILSSGLIAHRIAASFNDATLAPDQARIAYLNVGIKIVKDNPFFGVGPNRIRDEFVGYYGSGDVQHFYLGHLHNNFLQIAAERGLPSLAALLWFMALVVRDMFRFIRNAAGNAWLPLSALAAFISFIVAGLFEFNLGDSEVLMLTLFLISLPYGASKQGTYHLESGD